MFDNFNWDVEVHHWSHIMIGKIIIAPGVEFTVHKWNNTEGISAKNFRIGLSVNYQVLGCEGQVLTMASREQVEVYLKGQIKLAQEYTKIKAKKDAVQARIQPLQRKYSLLNDQIFSMVKE